MIRTYRATNGQMRVIADMPTPHLANAIAKLERERDAARGDELTSMRAEYANRPDKEPA